MGASRDDTCLGMARMHSAPRRRQHGRDSTLPDQSRPSSTIVDLEVFCCGFGGRPASRLLLVTEARESMGFGP